MSYFTDMTVAAGKFDINSESWHFHTITVDDDHDADNVAYVIERFVSSGYEILSVVIRTSSEEVDMWKHIGYASNIAPVHEVLSANKWDAESILAYLTVNDAADVDEWEDGTRISGCTHEELVSEWVEVYAPTVYELTGPYYSKNYAEAAKIPDFLVVDWEETAEYIARENGLSLVDYNGTLYYFD